MDILIVIPTKNRFYYIFKLINYYETIDFKRTLVINVQSNLKLKI